MRRTRRRYATRERTGETTTFGIRRWFGTLLFALSLSLPMKQYSACRVPRASARCPQSMPMERSQSMRTHHRRSGRRWPHHASISRNSRFSRFASTRKRTTFQQSTRKARRRNSLLPSVATGRALVSQRRVSCRISCVSELEGHIKSF